jgi:CheY-like chemotaxis protein
MNNDAPILLAEDDENDIYLLQLAFKKAAISRPLIIARDGQEAIDYLAGQAASTNSGSNPAPALLLLDLKMPRVDGFEVLAWLAEHPTLQTLPIVVLSSSAFESDIKKAQQLGAHDYRVKPPQFENLLQIVQELKSRWLPDTARTG